MRNDCSEYPPEPNDHRRHSNDRRLRLAVHDLPFTAQDIFSALAFEVSPNVAKLAPQKQNQKHYGTSYPATPNRTERWMD